VTLLACLASANAKGVQSGPSAGSMHTSSLTYDVSSPVLPRRQQHSFKPLGVQLDGPLYAGGVVYDSESGSLILTGAAYREIQDTRNGEFERSQCFITVLDLEDASFLHTEYFGYGGDSPASCSAVTYSPADDLAYAVGSTGKDGVFNDMVSNFDAVQYGLLFQFDVRLSKVIGGGVDDNDIVQYPVAITQATPEFVYAIFMGCDDNSVRINLEGEENPNLTSGGIREYGDDFYLVIKRYSVEVADDPPAEIPHSVHTDWSQVYKTDLGGVRPSGMTLAEDGSTLVIVGSTRYEGGAFGEMDGNDMDGWILKVDSTTGELLEQDGGMSTPRIDSYDKKDDWITGVCADPFDQDAVYIVGKTMGKIRDLADDQQLPDGSIHAFVAKIHLHVLGVTWSKHFTMTSGQSSEAAEAFGCVVTPEDDGNSLVYVTGVVEDSVLMDDATKGESAGKDDNFMAQNGQKGDINWIRQVGTPENDGLAIGGAITLDDFGNAIIY
jgi:hypothetical protein